MKAQAHLMAVRAQTPATDQSDSKRLVECVAVVTMLPALMSDNARSLAVAELRRLGFDHTRFSELYADIVRHIESYNGPA